MENQMFHVCTKGFSDRLLFRDRKDFIQGINRAALAFNGNCRIAAMCLMSNHVHFIAIGDEDKVGAEPLRRNGGHGAVPEP